MNTNPPAVPPQAFGPRIAAIDLIRGAVMILMAIDHVRVYSGLPPGGPTTGYPWSLALLSVVFAAAIVLLYFPRRWFADLEARRRDWWLRYL